MTMLARSQSRGGYKVRVLAVHTTEGGGTAAALRDADWWTGSSHAIADDQTLLTPAQGCVPYERASWTLRSGNPWSENIELVGMAGWSSAQWAAHPGLLDNCAKWLADRSKARGIPLVKLTPTQYRAGQSGVIGHHDHTVGYSDGTHWDPGPSFPWELVLGAARGYAEGVHFDAPAPLPLLESDMHFARTPDGTVWKITDYDVTPEPGIYRYGALSKARGGPKLVDISHEERLDNQGDAAERRARLLADIAKAAGGEVDEATIVAGLVPAITEALAGRTGATREEIAELLRGITLRAS